MGRNSLRTCFCANDCICWNMILSSSFPGTAESNEKLLGGLLGLQIRGRSLSAFHDLTSTLFLARHSLISCEGERWKLCSMSLCYESGRVTITAAVALLPLRSIMYVAYLASRIPENLKETVRADQRRDAGDLQRNARLENGGCVAREPLL